MATDMLYVSFWNICFENLAAGKFRRRRITPKKVKQLIEGARKKDRLMCVTDDFLAPYRKAELENQEELCGVLQKHFGIALALRDFTNTFDVEGEARYSVNPLVCVQVRKGHRVLVVNCRFSWEKGKRLGSGKLPLKIDPRTVEFHLIEAM